MLQGLGIFFPDGTKTRLKNYLLINLAPILRLRNLQQRFNWLDTFSKYVEDFFSKRTRLLVAL
jgi:hypothetical protein